MDNRTGKQCRERYINHLDPEMKKSAWTTQENDVIRDMFPEFGTKWSSYMPFLPGRSYNNIKNRYHTISRNKFSVCTDVPFHHLVTSNNKRAKSLHRCSSEDTDVDSFITGDSSEDTHFQRLEKLLAARIVMDLEILLLEKSITAEEEALQTSSPFFALHSPTAQGAAEMPVSESENDCDFMSDWTHDPDAVHADSEITTEQL